MPAAEYHDRQIKATVAAITGFLKVEDSEELGLIPDERMAPEFVTAWPQAVLPFSAGGLNMRQWAKYADAAFVGKVSLVINAAHHPTTQEDMFPMLTAACNAAVNGGTRMPEWQDCAAGTLDFTWSVNQAWHRLLTTARYTHDPLRPPQWITNTRADLARVAYMGDRAQKMASVTVTAAAIKAYARSIRGDAHRTRVWMMASAAGASGWRAMPWQEDGLLTLSNAEIIINFCLRLGLPLPRCWQGLKTGIDIEGPYGYEVLGTHRGSMKGWDKMHGEVQDNLIAMLRNAGCPYVDKEVRWWDRGRVNNAAVEHRVRPDVVATLPRFGDQVVVDVATSWKHLTSERHLYRAKGDGARRSELAKNTKYRAAMRRIYDVENPDMTFEAFMDQQIEHFFPAGVECTGGFGPQMERLFERIVQEATADQQGADLYHWSCMAFKTHWRTVIGCSLMRGAAYVLTREGVRQRSAQAWADRRVEQSRDGI